jgi:uncharacterized protein YbaR (Trm112 family)
MSEELPRDLLEALVCPVCKAELNYFKQRSILCCRKCHKKFNVENGIPIMAVE